MYNWRQFNITRSRGNCRWSVQRLLHDVYVVGGHPHPVQRLEVRVDVVRGAVVERLVEHAREAVQLVRVVAQAELAANMYDMGLET